MSLLWVMAVNVAGLPPEWQEHVRSYYDEAGKDAEDPATAENRCHTFADEFEDHVRERTGENRAPSISFLHVRELPSRRVGEHHDCTMYGHTVNYVPETGHVIDWTARQFDPHAQVPHIEPLSTYRHRWHHSDEADAGLTNSADCPECREAVKRWGL